MDSPIALALLIASVVLAGAGLVEDVALRLPEWRVLEDLALVGAWLGGAALLAGQLRALQRGSARLTRELDATRGDLTASRRGLGDAIARQLADWALTPSETEVAQLLLKGLGHRQIAELRGTSEKTVRQQAASVYRKAGVSNRAELSAYFLEDLLVL